MDERGVWVADSYLPVFAYVDVETGTVGEPWSAQEALGVQYTAHRLACDAEHLYVLGQAGLSALEKRSRRLAWQVPGVWLELVASHDRVWSLAGHDIVEIASGRVIHRYGLPGARCLGCAPQDGWQAVLAVPERQTGPITIARFDPGEVQPSWRVQLRGSSGGGWRNVFASSEVVWAIRRTPWQEGDIRHYLCGIDAETGDLISEVDICLRGRILVHKGVAWAWSLDHDPAGGQIQPLASAFDPRTGEVIADYDLGSGPAPWPAAGPAGVWCATYNDDGPWLKGVPASDFQLRTISLTSVDASGFRPPPPPSITVEQAESKALAAIRRDLLIGAHGEKLTEPQRTTLSNYIDVQAVVLEGAFPDTRLVVYFRSDSRPGYLFGRATRLWEDDGTFESDYYLAVTVNLQESLIACGHGLPVAPEADETDVVWF